MDYSDENGKKVYIETMREDIRQISDRLNSLERIGCAAGLVRDERINTMLRNVDDIVKNNEKMVKMLERQRSLIQYYLGGLATFLAIVTFLLGYILT